ncbi:MAG TPA: nicotinamide riboside transporter PnuC [Dysgonamonadaceae bacterium]|nr:nicotinamide riboside transporter PnuC [Dysgonamonadaceae bacterium]
MDIVIQLINAIDPLEFVGLIIGLLYLYLEYKANIWLWPVGVIMPLVYIVIFYQSKFYADMGIYVYYFFASIYGWYIWSKSIKKADEVLISQLPIKYLSKMIALFVIIFAAITFVLIRFTDSPVPYGDSLTTTLSIIAMWMLAHKYIEQWLLWIVVNIISTGLYFWKGLDTTAVLFIVYSIIPIFGYFKWKRMMVEQKNSEQ